MIIAIDFDGTIVEHKFPAVGELRKNALSIIKLLITEGHKIIIWTCRDKPGHIDEAIQFLKDNGLFEYVKINENWTTQFCPKPKVYADLYIDDRQLGGIPDDWIDIYGMIQDHLKK